MVQCRVQVSVALPQVLKLLLDKLKSIVVWSKENENQETVSSSVNVGGEASVRSG